jgi:protein tyrosine phosphatase (PTP) superfamily phosphohydrolase (DUF442 family)
MSETSRGLASWAAWALFLLGIYAGSLSAQEASVDVLRRVDSKWLPNAIWVHPSVMSGGLPAGKQAFEELAKLGIKTVISVDGIKPDVQNAEAVGLRYIHLPHGYDGISEDRLLQITKAVRDLPGPVYIHCHHGRHRSPAAAAAVCISLGRIDRSLGLETLRVAGTNPGFHGLVQTVERASRIPSARLDDLQIDWVAVSEVPPIVDTMVAMDSILDRLKEHQKRDWSGSLAETAADVLMLKEHYMELHRSESEKKQDPEFLELLEQGRTFAELLESKLSRDRATLSPEGSAHPDSIMKLLSNNCSQCHRQYRDNR